MRILLLLALAACSDYVDRVESRFRVEPGEPGTVNRAGCSKSRTDGVVLCQDSKYDTWICFIGVHDWPVACIRAEDPLRDGR